MIILIKIDNKNGNSYNTLKKLRVNDPLRIILGQLNINSIRNKFDALYSIFKPKIDVFSLAQFCVEGYSTPYRLYETCIGGVCSCM